MDIFIVAAAGTLFLFSLIRMQRCSPQWSARLAMCQWIRETLDKERIWDEARSTSLSRW